MSALSSDQLIAIARQHFNAGRIAPAEDLCRLVLRDLPRHEDALEILSRAKLRRLKPHASAAANYNLANDLLDADQIEPAIAAYQRAIELDPEFAPAHSNLGNALKAKCRVRDAIAAYDRAIALRPDLQQPRWNRALAALLVGDFESGWEGYKLRHQSFTSPARSAPQWNGESLSGKTILLWAEQGFGDTIQFIRYFDKVAALAGQVLIEAPPEFRQLLSGSSARDNPAAQTSYDFHCALLDLPGIFKTRIDTIPGDVPYLQPPAELTQRWRERLGNTGAKLRIGLAWAGRAEHQFDHLRSISPDQILPLAKIAGAEFHSLQKQPARIEAIIDHSHDLTNFAETAALIANLDLVISVDTAVAHLAGALAKPTWLLLAHSPDWRWQLDRSDSPWYPTMRLFRQTKIADWTPPIARAAESLEKLIAQDRGRTTCDSSKESCSSADCAADCAAIDAELSELLARWRTLPNVIKAAILAVARQNQSGENHSHCRNEPSESL